MESTNRIVNLCCIAHQLDVPEEVNNYISKVLKSQCLFGIVPEYPEAGDGCYLLKGILLPNPTPNVINFFSGKCKNNLILGISREIVQNNNNTPILEYKDVKDSYQFVVVC